MGQEAALVPIGLLHHPNSADQLMIGSADDFVNLIRCKLAAQFMVGSANDVVNLISFSGQDCISCQQTFVKPGTTVVLIRVINLNLKQIQVFYVTEWEFKFQFESADFMTKSKLHKKVTLSKFLVISIFC